MDYYINFKFRFEILFDHLCLTTLPRVVTLNMYLYTPVPKNGLLSFDQAIMISALLFGSDYGYERQANGKCSSAFWFDPNTATKTCSTSQSYLNSTG